MPTPDLPLLPTDDSMLSVKFGREIANYFSGSPLNRLSFLRSDNGFLRAAFSHPSAAFLLMNSLNPLVKDESHLAFVSKPDVESLTGSDPFEKTEEELAKEFNSEKTQPLILFLGVDDRSLLPTNGTGSEQFKYKEYTGNPYFAVDVTPRGTLSEAANGLINKLKEKNLSFGDHSPRHMGLAAPEGLNNPPSSPT
jgi:NAD+ diphosphatase